MAQKSNLSTLKPYAININLNEINTKIYLNLFKLLENLISAFLTKGVYIVYSNANISGNQCLLNFKCFYKTLKINAYKKRKFKKQKLIFIKKIKRLSILDSYCNLLKVNTFLFSFFNFNKLISKRVVLLVYKKTSKFIKQVFSRQFGLYLDFLKVTALLMQDLVGANLFLNIISTVFKNIDKSKHNRFVHFLQSLFKFLTSNSLTLTNVKDECSKIKGINGAKFVIHGRLQGKPRASNNIVLVGSVPIQTFQKNIDYALSHTYTKLGAFGMKLWLHKK
jgi:hypothetical protein